MSEYTIVEENNINLNYTVVDQDSAAVNITGATIKWGIRKSMDESMALTKTTSSGITITSGTGGTFTVALTPTDLTDLAVNDELTRYYMEAVITDSGANVYTITNDDFEPDVLKIRPIYTEA